MENVELIDLLGAYGRTTVQRWRHGRRGLRDEVRMEIGVLPDGRWYVAHTGFGWARAYTTESAARAVVDRLMAVLSGEWDEEPPPSHRLPEGAREGRHEFVGAL